ncbi:hypothetical protein P171DRAFT_378270 [Karstenula rhodostoma CBS 690.94]|uniref:F-box domain-containing protein n=1 Tax=Karstenula rhodostoma CBS 690.94 TaxID=1392251 RepID=A0A9P4PXW9_9PLEO|nr:hypothetical protein P171DRAFT_378270 [Karstenula rhodostoma CBS 690.94]
MHHLPDELVLHIICYLEPEELVNLQHVSRQFLRLSRDNKLWRNLCFEHSAAERRRRRLLPTTADVDPRLAELIRAANEVASAFPLSVHDPTAPSADVQVQRNVGRKRAALLANWDPSYPGEKVNFYQEFIQRHAPHELRWFQEARHGLREEGLRHEATGAGILYGEGGLAEKLVAPLEDGSVCVWDASAREGRLGCVVARSAVGLLPGKGSDLDMDTRLRQSRAAMTETGAVECVSVDSRAGKAFFAVQNIMNEVDLNTLQVVSRAPYPFPITALSEARHPTPLTVGTNWTLHLHDTRKPPSIPASASPPSSRCELIAGAPSSVPFSRLKTGDVGAHVSLAQPGALSIAHLPTAREWDANGDIWVAGRFTSLLNFDRRFFPRLRGTVHSGARLSCLSALPFPFVSRSSSSSSPVNTGYTLAAAGEYKGKGSLELYGLSPDPEKGVNSSDSRTTRNSSACYQNRQTASASKLLSVAPHGTRLVFSDGDGGVKWVERDACAPVRALNINTDIEKADTARGESIDAGEGDIVQKILPTVEASLHAARPEVPLGQDNLVLWTGDGRLGLLGFGQPAEEEWKDAVEEWGEETVERGREREYGVRMREALEMQAREMRWLRGYGL